MMKMKFTLLLLALFLGYGVSNGQQNEECINNLSIFSSYTKNKNYDAAYEPWMQVRTQCPGFNRAIYAKSKKSAGQDLLEYKIKNSTGADQVAFIKDLLKLYEEYNQYYASKFPKGEMYTDMGNLSYKYRKELGLSNKELYDIFDKGYNEDLKNFKDPRALYTYFSLYVKEYEKGPKTTNDTQALFNKYDDVKDKMEFEEGESAKKLNKLLEKEEAGIALTKKEKSYQRFYEQTLGVLETFTESTDGLAAQFAKCENLIPLYREKYEENKNDTEWLQRAMDKLYAKECSDDPLFIKIVKQKNSIAPNANTAYYLGYDAEKKGNNSEAERYYQQAEQLETNPLKKWKFVYGRAEKARKKGSYGKARQLYRQALKLNPSKKTPYYRIAAMYAASANNCGSSIFEKRAVYWAAAQEVGKVDSKAAASYRAKAPDKSMIFQEGKKSGESMSIGCWIGVTVRIP